MKILNLYAGIGGNRKLWENVEVVAVEIEPKIAKIYSYFFSNDKVIVVDAHQFLLKHLNINPEYNYINNNILPSIINMKKLIEDLTS